MKLGDMDYLYAECFKTEWINIYRIMKKVLALGEILAEYFLHSNAALAVAYCNYLADSKPNVASTTTLNKKGGRYGKS